jgi:hypothetical protein
MEHRIQHHSALALAFQHDCRIDVAAASRSEPRRAETDVDLVDAHLHPFDQSSEDNAPAGHRQLGPALTDLCAPRDKPLLN